MFGSDQAQRIFGGRSAFRIEANFAVYDFALSDEDMATLDDLDQSHGTDQARERKWW